jgi:hypothetical protein
VTADVTKVADVKAYVKAAVDTYSPPTPPADNSSSTAGAPRSVAL